MMKYINYLREKWEEHGLVFLVVVSLIFFVIYALFRIGEKGTYSADRSPYQLWSRSYRPIETPQPIRKKGDSMGEQICREYLEKTFRVPFKKERPDFLKNPVTGGYNLELDCFNRRMRLAVEYNGAQHYKYIPYFHRNKESFANQKYRDEMKRVKCKEHGICLIEVPYTVRNDDIPNFLRNELVKFGFLQ